MSEKAEKIAIDILDNYKKIRRIRAEFLSRKMRPLYTRYPRYKLFDFEHPYFEMDKHSKEIIQSYEKMMGSLLDVEIDGGSIRSEFEKMKIMLILSDKSDEEIDKLATL